MGRFINGSLPAGAGRFLRDVATSVVAAGLATFAFSSVTNAPTAPGNPAPLKVQDRIAWEAEKLPVRLTKTYDSIAMFGMPLVEPRAWSEPTPPAKRMDVAARAVPAERAEVAARRAAAAMPPIRPVVLAAASPAALPDGSATREGGGPFGLTLPGTDLLAMMPDGRQALNRIASLGGDVVSMGRAVAETIGLK